MNVPPGAPRKGLSTLTIVLIIVGGLGVLFLGTCAVGAVFLGREARKFQENISDGGLVLASPPEVRAELAGAKAGYVGAWKSKSGKSTLVIQPDGTLAMSLGERGVTENITAPIAAFLGNDIQMRVGLDFKVQVTVPPHQTAAQWEMVARGIDFRRDL